MGFLSPLPLTGLGSGPGASGFKSVQPALWAASGFLPEGTKNVQGSVQSQNATVAGLVDRLSLKDVSGAVQSQSSTVGGIVLAEKIVSGGVQAQSASVSGSLTPYPLTGWSLVNFTVDYAGLDPDSPFYGDITYASLSIGDKCHFETIATPGGGTISMNGAGEFSISPSVFTVPQDFDFQIYTLANGVFGTTATITIYPGDADKDVSGGVQAQDATVSGNVNRFDIHNVGGGVQAQNAVIDGLVVKSPVGTPTRFILGGVQAQSATISGTLERVITSFGNIQSQSSTVTGNLGKIVKASGGVQAQNATVTGDLTPPIEEPGTADSRRIGTKFINRKIRRKSNQRRIK